MARVKAINFPQAASFMTILLQTTGLAYVEAAEKLGWSPDRVRMMCRPEAGFDMRKLSYVLDRLKLSRDHLDLMLNLYLRNGIGQALINPRSTRVHL